MANCKCPVCNGKKEYDTEVSGVVYPVKCTFCGGKGTVPRPKRIKIRVKVNKDNLPDEFEFESKYLINKGDSDSEVGWSEITQAVLDKLKIDYEEIEE